MTKKGHSLNCNYWGLNSPKQMYFYLVWIQPAVIACYFVCTWNTETCVTCRKLTMFDTLFAEPRESHFYKYTKWYREYCRGQLYGFPGFGGPDPPATSGFLLWSVRAYDTLFPVTRSVQIWLQKCLYDPSPGEPSAAHYDTSHFRAGKALMEEREDCGGLAVLNQRDHKGHRVHPLGAGPRHHPYEWTIPE